MHCGLEQLLPTVLVGINFVHIMRRRRNINSCNFLHSCNADKNKRGGHSAFQQQKAALPLEATAIAIQLQI